MQKFLSWVISVGLAAFAVVFTAFNTAKVRAVFAPGGQEHEMQLSLLALGFMGVGFIAGATVVFLQNHKAAQLRRADHKRAQQFQVEIDRLRQQLQLGGSFDPPKRKPSLFLIGRK